MLISNNNLITVLLHKIDTVFVLDPETRVQHNGLVLTWMLFVLSVFTDMEN